MPRPKSPPKNGHIATKDLFHVAYLLTCGMSVKEILFDGQSHREKVTFILNGDEIQHHERRYRTMQAQVNLFQLKEAMKFAKDLMFDFLRSRQCCEEK